MKNIVPHVSALIVMLGCLLVLSLAQLPAQLPVTSVADQSLDNAYLELENGFTKYHQLTQVPAASVHMNRERFVQLPEAGSGVIGQYVGKANSSHTAALFPQIIVRERVPILLERAQGELRKFNPNYQLVVANGFRCLDDQQAVFAEVYNSLKHNYDNEADLLEAVHMKIAIPDVAGHPTGGAVDVTVLDRATGKYLDFGSEVGDFDAGRIIYYASPEITELQRENRLLLRNAMLSAGFAPFDGEWWHYSYGDKEWAYYYSEITRYNQMFAEDIVID